MINLSILVCGVHTRHDTFLPKIQKQLFDQYNSLVEQDRERVEIIVLIDNKKQVLGHKRNLMVDMAQGKYIAFVDDDDRVADDYICTLLEATASNADAILFWVSVTINGGLPKMTYFSKDVKADYDTVDGYYRIPNHVSCIKRSVSLKAAFPNIIYQEDVGYSKMLLPNLKTEHLIDKVLYYYDFSAETTETQNGN